MSLVTGIERTDELTAADRPLTDVGGALGVKHERRVIDRAVFGP